MSAGRAINVGRIELQALRLVVLCAERGTLSRAAAATHMSLSGASYKLARLEGALGVLIFRRRFRGLELTQAGEAVVEHCRAILSSVESLGRVSERLRYAKAEPWQGWHGHDAPQVSAPERDENVSVLDPPPSAHM